MKNKSKKPNKKLVCAARRALQRFQRSQDIEGSSFELLIKDFWKQCARFMADELRSAPGIKPVIKRSKATFPTR